MNIYKKLFGGMFTLIIILAISKVLGFVREVTIAGVYGVTNETDAFFLSSAMPGIIFPAICTSVGVVFVSQYTDIKNKSNSRERLAQYSSNVLTYCGFIAIFLSAIAAILMPFFIEFLVPGFDEETRELTIFMSRCTLATFVFIMFKFILSSIMNIEGRYNTAGTIGLLYNIILILCTFLLQKTFGIFALLIGFVMGTIAVPIALMIFTRDKNIFKLNFTFSLEIKEMFRLVIPVIIGNATVQITEIVDKALASYCDAGSITALSYSVAVYGLVVMTCSTIIDSVFYPYISNLVGKRDFSSIMYNIKETLNTGILILLPITVITVIFSQNIVGTIYERGSFSHSNTILVSGLLEIYALAFVFNFVNLVYTKVLYSNKKNKIVMQNGIMIMVFNIISSICLYKYFSISGIVTGSVLSFVCGSYLLNKHVKSTYPEFSFFNNNKNLVKIIFTLPIQIFTILICSKAFIIRNSILELIINSAILFIIVFLSLKLLKYDWKFILKEIEK